MDIKPLPADLAGPVSALLTKSFVAIDWDYEKLTPQEQACITLPQFRELVLWLVVTRQNDAELF